MIPPKRQRKTGHLAKRRREARRLRRDRKIYRTLRNLLRKSRRWHELMKVSPDPLSVYGGVFSPSTRHSLTAFPITANDIGGPIPPWEDLSSWLKTQLLVMAWHEWDMQTFTIHVHTKLENDWAATNKNPGGEIMKRMRSHMSREVGRRREYFFVIEGWSKQKKAEVPLHIHGGAFIAEPGDGPKLVKAAAKACGQGLHGAKSEPRAIHSQIYWKEGPKYVDYLFKSVRRKDQRLDRRRVHMSREAVGAGQEMWKLLTEPRS